jgi:hypothetical protein
MWHVRVHQNERISLSILIGLLDCIDCLVTVGSKVNSVLEIEVGQVSGAALYDYLQRIKIKRLVINNENSRLSSVIFLTYCFRVDIYLMVYLTLSSYCLMDVW